MFTRLQIPSKTLIDREVIHDGEWHSFSENRWEQGYFPCNQKGMAAANHHSYHSLLSNKAHTCSNHLLYLFIPKNIGTSSPHYHHTNIPSHLAELIETSSDMIDLEPGAGPVLSTTATPGDSPNAPSQQTLTSQHLGWKRKNLKKSKNHSSTSDLKKKSNFNSYTRFWSRHFGGS